MTRDEINAICGALPGAEVDDPWGGGHDAWKIGGKMFASMGTKGGGISVKTESIEQAAHLKDLGIGTKAPYFHASWILLPWDSEPEELRFRIHASYRLVREKLCL